jgi:predicted nucleic acid-binding protein
VEKVLADTTVLSNFAVVEREDLLRQVFGEDVVSVTEVIKELQQGEAKGLVPRRDWSWLVVLNRTTQHSYTS